MEAEPNSSQPAHEHIPSFENQDQPSKRVLSAKELFNIVQSSTPDWKPTAPHTLIVYSNSQSNSQHHQKTQSQSHFQKERYLSGCQHNQVTADIGRSTQVEPTERLQHVIQSLKKDKRDLETKIVGYLADIEEEKKKRAQHQATTLQNI